MSIFFYLFRRILTLVLQGKATAKRSGQFQKGYQAWSHKFFCVHTCLSFCEVGAVLTTGKHQVIFDDSWGVACLSEPVRQHCHLHCLWARFRHSSNHSLSTHSKREVCVISKCTVAQEPLSLKLLDNLVSFPRPPTDQCPIIRLSCQELQLWELTQKQHAMVQIFHRICLSSSNTHKKYISHSSVREKYLSNPFNFFYQHRRLYCQSTTPSVHPSIRQLWSLCLYQRD